jgi:hypothetical protein
MKALITKITRPSTDNEWPHIIFPRYTHEGLQGVSALADVRFYLALLEDDPTLNDYNFIGNIVSDCLTYYHIVLFINEEEFSANRDEVYQHMPLWNNTESKDYEEANNLIVEMYEEEFDISKYFLAAVRPLPGPGNFVTIS